MSTLQIVKARVNIIFSPTKFVFDDVKLLFINTHILLRLALVAFSRLVSQISTINYATDINTCHV
jgi:hypothetical protein